MKNRHHQSSTWETRVSHEGTWAGALSLGQLIDLYLPRRKTRRGGVAGSCGPAEDFVFPLWAPAHDWSNFKNPHGLRTSERQNRLREMVVDTPTKVVPGAGSMECGKNGEQWKYSSHMDINMSAEMLAEVSPPIPAAVTCTSCVTDRRDRQFLS